MYHRGKIANIDRSSKRDDGFILSKIEEAMGILVFNGGKLVPVLPFRGDPKFSEVDPENFLVPCAVRLIGLSWYEVEHFLDNISSISPRYQFHKTTLVFMDERRRFYQRGRFPCNTFFYFSN
jgi:hypothetical protein